MLGLSRGNPSTAATTGASLLLIGFLFPLMFAACGGGGSSSGGGGTPPSATTGAASGVTSSGAVLSGTVNPNGTATEAWFEYGTDPGLSGASRTSTQSIGSGNADVPINATANGLAAGTTYYYRVCASNGSGSASGAIAGCTTANQGTGPTVIAVTPLNGTPNAGLSALISATFSTSMDPSTIDGSTVRIQSGGVDVTGGLFYGTTYVVTITTGVRDLSGNRMAQDYTWQFTTEQAPSGSLAGVLTLDGNVGVSYDDPSRTATVKTSGIVSLAGIGVKAVQTSADYATALFEGSSTTAAAGAFSFSSLGDGKYFLNADFTDPGGSGRRYLALGTTSLLGSQKVVAVPVRDVTPTPSASALDAFCRECHPLVPTEPAQIQSCGDHYYPIDNSVSPDAGVLDAYGRITCESCHSNHVPTGTLHFVLEPYEDGTLCFRCH